MRHVPLLLILSASLPAGAASPPKAPRYDIVYSREVVTPRLRPAR
jgi:hypothetical protein